MAALTLKQADRDGVIVPATAADLAGDTFENPGQRNALFVIQNGSGASIDVTFKIVTVIDGITVPDKVVSVGPGETKVIGPFTSDYEDTSSGGRTVSATYSSVTSILVDVITWDTALA